MKYSTINQKLRKAKDVYRRCTIPLKNGATVQITQMERGGAHDCILYDPLGRDIESMGGLDEIDTEEYVTECEERDDFETELHDEWEQHNP